MIFNAIRIERRVERANNSTFPASMTPRTFAPIELIRSLDNATSRTVSYAPLLSAPPGIVMLVLENPVVHVWISDQKKSAHDLHSLTRVLNLEERQRADKFRFEADRVRYAFARSTLRRVLARYINRSPENIVFDTNCFGKLYIKDRENNGPLSFNLSHSGRLALIAVAWDRLVGVDIEEIRQIDNVHALAKEYFTIQEQRFLLAAALRSKVQEAFYACWTRKEAYIKAIGKGLSIPLTSFDTSLPAGTAGRPLNKSPDAPAVDTWWLSDLSVPDGYAAALVTEGAMPVILYQSLD